MTGLLKRKYHVAILDNTADGVSSIISCIRGWYNNRVVIETYKTPETLIDAVNLHKAKNHPFDLAVLSSNEIAERFILKQSNPSLKVAIRQDKKLLL